VKLRQDFFIGVQDVDQNKRITNHALLEMLSDISMLHGVKAGQTSTEGRSTVSWIVLGWRVKVYKRPSMFSTVSVYTWAQQHGHVRANRDYLVCDENGEKILIQTTQPDSDVVITIQRIFDKRGNLVTYIQDTGFYVGRYEYQYNQKNQRVREEYYRDDALLDYIDFTWEGNVGTGTSYQADGTPMGKKLLEYDKYGNLLRLESQDLLGTTLTVNCMEYIGTDGTVSSGIPND